MNRILVIEDELDIADLMAVREGMKMRWQAQRDTALWEGRPVETAPGKSRGHGKRSDLRFDHGTSLRPCLAQIVFLLETDPELRAGAEIPAQAQGSVR
jgi:hypothetical protein